jgi:hypothetical protein
MRDEKFQKKTARGDHLFLVAAAHEGQDSALKRLQQLHWNKQRSAQSQPSFDGNCDVLP